MKSLLSILTILLFTVSQAQETSIAPANDKLKSTYKHSIGVAAGITTGYGLSYRFWPKRFGAQITFAPNFQEEEHRYSLGLTALVKLVETKHVNLFLYEGNHLNASRRYNEYAYYSEDGYYQYGQGYNTSKDWYNGVGMGLEFKFRDHGSFNLMAGYASYNNFENLNMTVETGLYFKF